MTSDLLWQKNVSSVYPNEQARTAFLFLFALFALYGPAASLRLEIRPGFPLWREAELYPTGNAPKNWQFYTPRGVRQWFPLTEAGIRAAARHAIKLAGRYEVYFGVLPRLGKYGTQSDAPMSFWLWCDVDSGTDGVDGAVALVKRADVPRPHIAVVSGGGLHCYWRLDGLIDLPDAEARKGIKEVLQRLCRAIGGESPAAHADSSRADVASLLRVAGTLNNKREGEPRAVRLLRFAPDAEAHSLTWWRANLPAIPLPAVPARQWQPPTYASREYGEGLLRWARKGYCESERHTRLVSDAAWLVRTRGIDKETARDLLRMKVAVSSGTHPVTEEELEGIIEWA